MESVSLINGPLLSIIITSYNIERLKGIYELLDSIGSQTYGNTETIFVAECSRELYEQVGMYAEKRAIPNFRALFNDGEQGASAARNMGIRESNGEIVAFIDDDAVAFPDWAEQMIRTYEDDSVIGVTGPAVPLWEDDSWAWFPKELHWVISCTSWCQWKEITEVRNVWLENASFRREAFERAGLIDTELGPMDASHGFKGREFAQKIISEEVELSLRVTKATKKRIMYNPMVRVRHRVDTRRLKLSYITRWAYWMGHSRGRLKRLYSGTDDDMLNQERHLLACILTGLFPRIVCNFFHDPVAGWRKLSVTVAALAFVSLGYLTAFPATGGAKQRADCGQDEETRFSGQGTVQIRRKASPREGWGRK